MTDAQTNLDIGRVLNLDILDFRMITRPNPSMEAKSNIRYIHIDGCSKKELDNLLASSS